MIIHDRKLALQLGVVAVLVTSFAGTASAEPYPRHMHAPAAADGAAFYGLSAESQAPAAQQAKPQVGGTYNALSDFVRSVEGTP